jgi:hypothetical protein
MFNKMKFLYTGMSLIATVYFLDFFGIKITEKYEDRLFERCREFQEGVQSSIVE